MAETIQGLKRSCRAEELSETMLGQELTLMGWCQKQRDLGGLIFITLRDRSGLLQLVADDDSPAEVREKAARVRSEYVLAARGVLRLREAPNPEMPTGLWELHLQELRILSEAKTPPFYIEEGVEVKESLRLQHRYLDLRRPDMQAVIKLRSDVSNFTRHFFEDEGFLDIETPMMGKSTPEGARDYLVPSRVFQGRFFALPQSPQLYKQLLMTAGCDRYFQIARCFRDEDLRADRQPEFSQIDLEMSFVDREDVMNMVETYLVELLRKIKGQALDEPFLRLTWREAMERYGSDKPDLRFGLELCDISDLAAAMDFQVFAQALAGGGSVRLITVPGGGSMTRKEIDKLGEFVKTYKAKGLAWLAPAQEWRGSILKFVDSESRDALLERSGAAEGDLLLIVADPDNRVVLDALGHLRAEVAAKRGLFDPATDKLLWVTDFPLLEWDEEAGRYSAMHHPFTMPMDEDIPLLDTDPGQVRAKAYDIVMNGYELGGGSIRIHDRDLQNRMFGLLGFTEEAAYANFSFLLDAFSYGVPPHGGLAIGLDRLIMLLAGLDNIREVIAFPKVQTSADLMTQAPGEVSRKQLDELGLLIETSGTDQDASMEAAKENE